MERPWQAPPGPKPESLVAVAACLENRRGQVLQARCLDQSGHSRELKRRPGSLWLDPAHSLGPSSCPLQQRRCQRTSPLEQEPERRREQLTEGLCAWYEP